MVLFFLALVLLCAGAFAFLNGFRDASSSVALAVRTRALTPTVAVLLASLFNFIGAGLSAALALAVSQAWLSLPPGTNGLTILLAGAAERHPLGRLHVVARHSRRPPPMPWSAASPGRGSRASPSAATPSPALTPRSCPRWCSRC